jgi:DNA primase large subunit
LKERLGEKLNVDDEIRNLIQPSLKNIEPVVLEEKKKAGKIKFEKTDISCFPPCMLKILEDLKSGVNVPHTARFAITSFLLNVGFDVEEIIAMFSSAPDFNEEMTRYQVEHIAGSKGTEYDCPACDTMRTYHNCVKDCKTYHPISFYEKCMRGKHRMKSYKS